MGSWSSGALLPREKDDVGIEGAWKCGVACLGLMWGILQGTLCSPIRGPAGTGSHSMSAAEHFSSQQLVFFKTTSRYLHIVNQREYRYFHVQGDRNSSAAEQLVASSPFWPCLYVNRHISSTLRDGTSESPT